MLAVARAKIPGANFREGDLHHLPVPDRCADVVVCALALTHIFAAGQGNSDPAVAAEFLAAEAGDGGAAAGGGTGAEGGQRPGGAGGPEDGQDGGDLSWYGDSAYGTGDLRDAVAKAGHQAVIKPKPVRPAVQGGLTVDDFSVDGQQGTVTCPAGHTVTLSRTRVATFGVLCRGCPLREQCTTCKTGRKLVLHPHDALLRAARRDRPGLREDYMAHRPNVERAVAQVATWRGRRLKLRYRGVTKNHAWLTRRTAALNLRNLTPAQTAGQAGWRAGATTARSPRPPAWPEPATPPRQPP